MPDDYAVRKFDLSYIRRASAIDPTAASEHLDSIAISLHQALDAWRGGTGGAEEVTMCVDALAALWSVVERRESTRGVRAIDSN